MKHVQFDYVNSFSCLAGACPDTCCKDWQIILIATPSRATLPCPVNWANRYRRQW